jgi:hypothetical protein
LANNLYKVTPGPSNPPLSSDINQFIDALNGSNDIGAITFAAPISAPQLAAPSATQTIFSDTLTSYTGSSVPSPWTLRGGSFTFSASGATSGANGSIISAGSISWKPLNGLSLTIQATFTMPASVPSGFALILQLQDANGNLYRISSESSGQLVLRKYVAGTPTVIAGPVTQVLSANSSYTATLSITPSGQLTAKLYSGVGTGGTLLQTLTANDTTLTGGFIIAVGGDSGVIIKNAQVTGPTNATVVSGTALGIGNYNYRLTYVVGYKKSNNSIVFGNETNGSATISITTTSGNQAVALSGLPMTWPATAVALRIYRTAVNGADGTEKLVATLTSPQSTFIDTTPDASLGAAVPTTNKTGVSFGASNQDVFRVQALEVNVDTRSTTLTYSNGNLTQVVEQDGSTAVRTTNLTYDGNGNLTQVQEIVGANTITTILSYDGNGNLIGISRTVV